MGLTRRRMTRLAWLLLAGTALLAAVDALGLLRVERLADLARQDLPQGLARSHGAPDQGFRHDQRQRVEATAAPRTASRKEARAKVCFATDRRRAARSRCPDTAR